MNEPSLITTDDERDRCCVLAEGTLERCPNTSKFWVGTHKTLDDYTHVCQGHLDFVKRDGDEVTEL